VHQRLAVEHEPHLDDVAHFQIADQRVRDASAIEARGRQFRSARDLLFGHGMVGKTERDQLHLFRAECSGRTQLQKEAGGDREKRQA
jgi:hypothetical protein